MPNFSSILETIERDAAVRDALRRIGPSPFPALPIEPISQPAPDRHAARRAYAAQSRSRSADDTPPPTVDALCRAILAAGRDAKRLRHLRRVAARTLHPDRGGDGAELAECNALIDAALRTSRRRT